MDFAHYLISETMNLIDKNINLHNEISLSCPICHYQSNQFIHLSNRFNISWNSVCNNCNSRSRHRGLYFLYKEYLEIKKDKKILHFAPEPMLEDKIRNYNNHYYYTTDYYISGVDYPNEDIQDLSFNNSSFDLILNNHVLEHISDDNKGLAEISRILKKNGIAILTVPGDWKRLYTKTFSHLQFNGHYRDYGLDFIEKLKKHFSQIKKCNLYQFNGESHAIKPNEIAFICIK